MLVEVRNLTKRFGRTIALSDVTMGVSEGTVHGIVGENGAGKSTLGRIIGGAARPDNGELLINGTARVFRSPHDASRAGVALVAQDLALVPALSVRDNVLLGIEPTARGLLSRRSSKSAYQASASVAGFSLAQDARVSDLNVADQQKVEILRAMSRNARIIVMDEPTSSLTRDESQRLHDIVRDLKARGTTVIYISHFLDEILGLADDVTVLRNGKMVRSGPASSETVNSLIKAMIGTDTDGLFPDRPRLRPSSPIALSVRGVESRGIRDVDLDIRSGEIVGLAGLVGSGRSSVARAVFGADRSARGTVTVNGAMVPPGSTRLAIRSGVAFVPEDRQHQGLELALSQMANVSLPHLDTVSRRGWMLAKRERVETTEALRRVDVRPLMLKRPVAELSGGNQQKVLFAKWLFRSPRVLLLDEPTRGVDIGARRTIHDLICALAEQGMAILLISSDLDEVLALSHRVLVMRLGRIVAEFAAPFDAEVVLASAFGRAQAAVAQ